MELLNKNRYIVCAPRYISMCMYRHEYHMTTVPTELWNFVTAQCFNCKSALDKSVNNAIIVR